MWHECRTEQVEDYVDVSDVEGEIENVDPVEVFRDAFAQQSLLLLEVDWARESAEAEVDVALIVSVASQRTEHAREVVRVGQDDFSWTTE